MVLLDSCSCCFFDKDVLVFCVDLYSCKLQFKYSLGKPDVFRKKQRYLVKSTASDITQGFQVVFPKTPIEAK